MRRVLLVIDMLRDFIEADGALYCGKQGEAIVPFVKSRIEAYRERGEDIFYICDCHEETDLEFQRFPIHCVKGTPGAQILPELAFAATDENRILKRRFSAFFETNLEEALKAYDEVELVGVCTNICVLYTAEELCNRDKKTVVHRAGVASFDAAAHENALEQMESVLGVTVME